MNRPSSIRLKSLPPRSSEPVPTAGGSDLLSIRAEFRTRRRRGRPSARNRPVDRSILLDLYHALWAAAGHRNWWPGRTRLEIILGAILTQKTAWTNVEKALSSLRAGGLLRWERLRELPEAELAATIRSSGTYRQKARRIRAFVRFLEERYGGSLSRMAREETGSLRRDLLSVWGIGPETADSILLYAFRRPVFVVDAYTLRVLVRHGYLQAGSGYAEAQQLLHKHLPPQEPLYNDYHAQFVWVGQTRCRTAPRCHGCPLQPFLPPSGPVETYVRSQEY
jgi:endonuclease III related protein